MTWEIAAGVIALAGFTVTVGSLAAKLSGALTRLDSAVRELGEAIAEMRRENDTGHRVMRTHLEDHEKRITILEVQANERH